MELTLAMVVKTMMLVATPILLFVVAPLVSKSLGK
jgi:hypothetical protein